MAITQSNPAAAPYAQSMLELAAAQGQTDAIGAELADLRQVLRDTPSFAQFLSDPGIGNTERTEAVERVLKGRVSPLVWNLIGVLNARGRLSILSAVADTYEDLLEEERGLVEVDVTVAQRLDADQLELVRSRVSAAIGKTAVVHQYVDESIIGGIVLRVGDKQIDASVRHQLQSLRQRLLVARRK